MSASRTNRRKTTLRDSVSLWFVIACVFAAVSTPAHHSHAMFDHAVEVSVTGTVTNFSYRNPHVYLYLDVKDAKGAVVKWAIEMSNVDNMRSRGIVPSTFRVGDIVTVKINPLRNGRPGGNYTSVIAADGKTYE